MSHFSGTNKNIGKEIASWKLSKSRRRYETPTILMWPKFRGRWNKAVMYSLWTVAEYSTHKTKDVTMLPPMPIPSRNLMQVNAVIVGITVTKLPLTAIVRQEAENVVSRPYLKHYLW